MNEEQTYSHAFDSLVQGKDDIPGMIAYCSYKRQKKEFCQKSKLDRNSDQVINYHADLNSDRIENLREAALVVIQRYSTTVANEVLSKESERMRKDAFVQEVVATVRESTSWWRSIFYSAVGGAFLGLVLVGAAKIGFMNPFSAVIDSDSSENKRQ